MVRIRIVLAIQLAVWLSASHVWADAVTEWNEVTVKATKGFDGVTGTGVTLDTNLASRIGAIEARAVFDAVNAVDGFAAGSYDYAASGRETGSAAAAAAVAAHDVLLGALPDPAGDATADSRWAPVRAWLDGQLAADLAAWGVDASDGGIALGHVAAAAGLAARKVDNASPVTTWGAALVPTANPGVGVWRQSNAAAVFINPVTGAPTGFDVTGAVIQGRPGIDLNWRDLAPFSLSNSQKAALVADVPLSPLVGSPEYLRELDYVRRHGQDTAAASIRSDDQTAQALYYKQDAEILHQRGGPYRLGNTRVDARSERSALRLA